MARNKQYHSRCYTAGVRVFVLSVALLVAATITAQAPPKDALPRLLREVRAAMEKDDFVQAADLAEKIQRSIEDQSRRAAIMSFPKLFDEILSWIPADTETLLVHQEPFTLNAEILPDRIFGHPTERYLLNPLGVADGGRHYEALNGRAILCGVIAARDLAGDIPRITPAAPVPEADLLYFILFAEPLDPRLFGDPTITREARPSWTLESVRNRKQWMALAKPNLLVLATYEKSLDDLLARVAKQDAAAGFAVSNVDWSLVDRRQSAWGVRKATPDSKDALRIGIGLTFDSAARLLEVRFRGSFPGFEREENLKIEYQPCESSSGLTCWKADLKARGDYSAHHVFGLMGLGEFR